MSRNKIGNYVMVFLAVSMCLYSGYATLSKKLDVSGVSSVSGDFDVGIIDIVPSNTTGNAKSGDIVIDASTHSASFTTELYNKNDSVEYSVTIKNAGDIKSRISDIKTESSVASDSISFTYEGVELNQVLVPQQTVTFKVKIAVVDTGNDLEDIIGAVYTLSLEFMQDD